MMTLGRSSSIGAKNGMMTSRERILTAMRRGVPDRVPVIPDISNMIPARLTGKPFWDIYFHRDPPLWKAYLHAMEYFAFQLISNL